jgi:DNA-binding MarR family transcriptional regulator
MDEINEIGPIIQTYWDIFGAVERGTMPAWVHLSLSTAQLKVLFLLHYGGPLSIGQVADILGITLATASHLVEKLVEAGYVARTVDADDRRRAWASVTPEGRQTALQLRQGRYSLLEEWLAQLDEPALASLRAGLSALHEIAMRAQPKPPGFVLKNGKECNVSNP